MDYGRWKISERLNLKKEVQYAKIIFSILTSMITVIWNWIFSNLCPQTCRRVVPIDREQQCRQPVVCGAGCLIGAAAFTASGRPDVLVAAAQNVQQFGPAPVPQLAGQQLLGGGLEQFANRNKMGGAHN